MSSPQSKSTQMTEMPTAVAERTRRDTRCSVEGSLDRKGDERLHVGRCHAVPLDEHRDGRRGEVRQHVDRDACCFVRTHTKNAPAAASTAMRFRNDHAIRPSIIVVSLVSTWVCCVKLVCVPVRRNLRREGRQSNEWCTTNDNPVAGPDVAGDLHGA